MVGSLKDVLEGHKGLSLHQYVETMRTLLVELQYLSKKAPLRQRKTVPIGLFCMSGPVAHADDEEDEDTENLKKLDHENIAPNSLEYKAWLATQTEHLNRLMEDAHMGYGDKPRPTRDCVDMGIQSNNVMKRSWSNGWLCEGERGLDDQRERGEIVWPSGSFYEGEIVKGSLHGVGTYRGADGTIYKGNWRMNKKQGFGWKQYANADMYEGTWRRDVPDGHGRYIWSNGSEYYGQWKQGMMSGRGVLVWASGDKYDGHWREGFANGRGVYTWADGSTYFGTWRKGLKHGAGRFFPPGSKGLKHGAGRFFPPGSKHSERDGLSYSSSGSFEEDHASDAELESTRRQKVCSPSHVPCELRRPGFGLPPDATTLGMVASALDLRDDHNIVLEGLWKLENPAAFLPNANDLMDAEKIAFKDADGNLLHGEELSGSEGDYSHLTWLFDEKRRLGETIFKGHRRYDFMTSLQLGIRHSVGKVPVKCKIKLLPAAFGSKARTKLNFPREGSQLTPPHQAGDFKWKDYCPTVFRKLRDLFEVDAAEYMLSLCGNNLLRELPSPGKSGSIFYLSQDERFMIKTLRKAEVKVILRMLPRYYNHVQENKSTLLTRFLGLHRYQNANGHKVRFIVMGNVVSTDLFIHRRFDLKGSLQGRSAEKEDTDESITLKDLDLEYVFQLDQPWREAILNQISKDCKFLESEHIMDYSLLLGLHFKDIPPTDTTGSGDSVFELPLHDVVLSRFLAENGGFVEVEVIPKQRIVKSPGFEDMELRRQALLENAKEEAAELDVLAPQEKRGKLPVGYNVPAKAYRRNASGKVHVDSKESYNVLLYFGVIDILQEYDMGKKLEHAYKSFQFDSLSISAVDPVLYSKRFQQFMHEIFLT